MIYKQTLAACCKPSTLCGLLWIANPCISIEDDSDGVMWLTPKPVTCHHSTEREDDSTLNAFAIPFELISLADLGLLLEALAETLRQEQVDYLIIDCRLPSMKSDRIS